MRKMGSRRRTPVKTGVTTYNGNAPNTTQLNKNMFEPCKICNRRFRNYDRAVEHFKLCSSQNIEMTNGATPEEVKKNFNNNYIQNNNTKNVRRNSERLRKNLSRCNNYISVPKKQSSKSKNSNVELNNFPKKLKLSTQQISVNENQEELNNVMKSPVNTRRRKKLTEEEIDERLRIISEKLKQTADSFDDDDEDEREEIEYRLMELNKDSETTYLDDYPDEDDNSRCLPKKFADGVNSRFTNGNDETATDFKQPIIVTQKPDGQLHGCRVCSEVFVSELDLFRHKRDKHRAPKIIMDTKEIKKFYDLADRSQCPVCHKVLVSTNKTIFIKHLQSHNSVGEFVCSVCRRVFKRKDHMKMHEKRHIV